MLAPATQRGYQLIAQKVEVGARVQHRVGGLSAFDTAQDFAMLALQQPERAGALRRPALLAVADVLELGAEVFNHACQQRIAGLRGDGGVQAELELLPLDWIRWRKHVLIELADQAAN